MSLGICMNTLEAIEVDITVELGATTMPIHHLLRMGRGAVIELDTTENDPLRVYQFRHDRTPVVGAPPEGEARQRVATHFRWRKRLNRHAPSPGKTTRASVFCG